MKIDIDTSDFDVLIEKIDVAIEKGNQLIALLEKVAELIDSLQCMRRKTMTIEDIKSATESTETIKKNAAPNEHTFDTAESAFMIAAAQIAKEKNLDVDSLLR